MFHEIMNISRYFKKQPEIQLKTFPPEKWKPKAMKRLKKNTKFVEKVFTQVKPVTIVDLTNSLVNSKMYK